VHVLLVTTLANGIFAAVQQIRDNPSQIMSMLASTLPQASTFFLSFILLSLIGVPMMLLQIGPLIMYQVGKILSSTPRQMYATERNMGAVDWGTTIPVHTIVFAIGMHFIFNFEQFNGRLCSHLIF
jgi:tetrahydromethanopterin S-methyltransferase subunit E